MRQLNFCLGNSRKSAVWHPKQMTADELEERLKTPIRTAETVQEYRQMKKNEKKAVKDKGGFVAGKLKGTRRKKSDVDSRSMITIGGDKLKPDFFDKFNPGYFAIVYTTHSHMPEAPRARIFIPLARDVSPDEFNAITRYLAEEIGMEQIDPCSFEINQLMYWPTCPADGKYICKKYDGAWLDPESF